MEILLAAVAIAGGAIYLLGMPSDAGGLGFPLDDSWIPLTFAKNLRAFGAYSYHARDMITSGSTSPLYVFLLAALGFAISNEFVLASVVGILSFALAAIFTFRAGLRIFHEEQWLAAVAAFFVTPLFSALSRRDEREADRFACDLTGEPAALASALIKLSRENLSNLHPHPLYAAFYHSHPPVVERVRVLRASANA